MFREEFTSILQNFSQKIEKEGRYTDPSYDAHNFQVPKPGKNKSKQNFSFTRKKNK